MKKYISIGLALTLVCALLVGCGTTNTITSSTDTVNTVNNDTEIIENTSVDTSSTEVAPCFDVFSLAGEIVELGDSTIVVKRITTATEDIQNNVIIKYDYSKLNLVVGNIIKVAYTDKSEINEITSIIDVTFVADNLEEFESPLTDSEKNEITSIIDVTFVAENSEKKAREWGIQMTAGNVTPSGLTLICNQEGGENVVELNTGSFYKLEVLKDDVYCNVDYVLEPNDIAWTSESYIVALNDTTTWDINWEWLYGKLPAGQYRIVKEIINFKGPGNADEEYIFVEFEITE